MGGDKEGRVVLIGVDGSEVVLTVREGRKEEGKRRENKERREGREARKKVKGQKGKGKGGKGREEMKEGRDKGMGEG